ncbi:MAG: chemotaxis protein CheB, partial [Mycobacteriaceae bacterium]|nr:chemotaxis protein CheB [Mycobacteriaceae bacterium]
MATELHECAVEVIALVASAGGLDALAIVLRDLPSQFPAAVVVYQHLGNQDSVMPEILARRAGRAVTWARDGQILTPGQVIVGPPRTCMELTPDGFCRLHRLDGVGVQRFDVLLSSLAGSYGARSVAVVLSGSGHDGAAGTAAMARTGAVVIAQSPETAAYPAMPIAAAMAGAAFVLPVTAIGRFLAGITEGPTSMRQWHQSDTATTFFDGPGGAREFLRETDWAATPLGAFLERRTELHLLLRSMSDSGNSMSVWWGRDDVYVTGEITDHTWEGVQRARAARQGPKVDTGGVLFFRQGCSIVAVNDSFLELLDGRCGPSGPAPPVDLASDQILDAISAVLRRRADPAFSVPDAAAGNVWTLCSDLVAGTAGAGAGAAVALVEAQFAALMRSAKQGVDPTDTEDRLGDSVSWQEFTGQTVDEWIGWGLLRATPPALGDTTGSDNRRLRRTGFCTRGTRTTVIPLRSLLESPVRRSRDSTGYGALARGETAGQRA